MVDLDHTVPFLFARFPDVRKNTHLIEDSLDYPHVVYETAFVPYIKSALRSNDLPAIEKIFDFMEELACANDERVENLLQVSILEPLWDDYAAFQKLHIYMLPNTQSINRRIAEYMAEPKAIVNNAK